MLDLPGAPQRVLNKLRDLDYEGIYDLDERALMSAWGLTREDLHVLSTALVAAGWPALDVPPPRVARAKAPPKLCREGDGRERMKGKQDCTWHWLKKQPIADQVRQADHRRRAALAAPGFVERARVPREQWPAGERWCSACQGFVPLFYTSGSRCYAHGSAANHESHVTRTYELEPGEYAALLAWQGGRCYICRQVPRVRRLAVDHDHVTNEVRGLLCANDEWGCNVLLRRLLGDEGMALRALEYAQRTPLERFRAGEHRPGAR